MEIYQPFGGVGDSWDNMKAVCYDKIILFCVTRYFSYIDGLFSGKILNLVASYKPCVELVCTCNTLSLRIQTGQAIDLFGCSLKEVSSSTLGIL